MRRARSSPGIVVLTATAWLALLLYVLACRPSWSPDGTKLLVPFHDPITDTTSVTLFDATTGASRTLLVRRNLGSDDVMMAQWHSDGERAIIWFAEDEVMLLSTERTVPLRSYQLSNNVDSSILPPPQLGRFLYFPGNSITRLDLETGKVELGPAAKTLALYAAGGRLLYLAETEDGYVVGDVEPDELTIAPFLELDDVELASLGVTELTGYAAFEPDGERFLFAGTFERGTRLVVCRKASIDGVLTPSIEGEIFGLTNVVWANGDLLYAAAFTPLPEIEETQFSLAEIRLHDMSTRIVPLGRIKESFTDTDDYPALGEIALSPDGTTMAALITWVDEFSVTEDVRAVYLVDLDDPDRAVRRLPVPEL